MEQVRNFESQMQMAVNVKFANSAENSVLQALQFHQISVPRKLPGGTGIRRY
jgi:hypothetical protein